jgi:hypothetical protein
MTTKQFQIKCLLKESQGRIETTLFVAKLFLFNPELSPAAFQMQRNRLFSRN